MNTSKPDSNLLYELNMARRRLDLEIIAAEKQLENVKKRLDGLMHDLYIYLGLLVAPVILFVILNMFTMIPSQSVLFLFLVIIKYIILCIYVIMLPANIYHLIYAIMLLRINKENNLAVDLPLLEGVRRGGAPPQERSFRSEHDKLLLVLTRYYLVLERLEQLQASEGYHVILYHRHRISCYHKGEENLRHVFQGGGQAKYIWDRCQGLWRQHNRIYTAVRSERESQCGIRLGQAAQPLHIRT